MPTVSDVQCRMVGDRWQGGVAGFEVKGRLGLGFNEKREVLPPFCGKFLLS
ncbi:hypothetical protein NG798_18930 [Ancylothrix sp. C2]|uniref:hypothetical protein n=1 Tax=Ancylothrix sp. D3o TaxID=2953691 RepID=UPI0021BB602E|nr:hypothetical protein [Ancylothrix sp. D3o]MCT7951879.1 hypothetical protein [Ancylothrix sp. D3o]